MSNPVDGVTATQCTFCGSNKVLEQGENQSSIRSESLLPFGIDKKRAGQSFGDWLGMLWFRPNDLKVMAKVQEVNGVYVPFWTYDAHVESSWQAEAGYYYFETEEYTTKENGEEVVKTREVQPGTGEPGNSWHSRSPDPDDEDDKLNQALKDSFPASDPPQPAQPGVTGWDAPKAK